MEDEPTKLELLKALRQSMADTIELERLYHEARGENAPQRDGFRATLAELDSDIAALGGKNTT